MVKIFFGIWFYGFKMNVEYREHSRWSPSISLHLYRIIKNLRKKNLSLAGRPKPSLHWLSNGRHVVQYETYSGLEDQNRVLGQSVNEDEVVTSTLVVGPVHRRDVDSSFTCLASNSNMTQASRATVVLQMNCKWIKNKIHILSRVI